MFLTLKNIFYKNFTIIFSSSNDKALFRGNTFSSHTFALISYLKYKQKLSNDKKSNFRFTLMSGCATFISVDVALADR